jgi:hypothetical protein
MRTFLVPPIAAAITLCMLGASSPAAAKPMTCQVKREACSNRCVGKDDGKGVNDALNCMNRTCERQFRNCMSDAAGGSDRTGTGVRGGSGTKTGGPIVRDKRRPRGGRLTESGAEPLSVPFMPAGTGSSGVPGGGQPAVRDHRIRRAGPGWGIR